MPWQFWNTAINDWTYIEDEVIDRYNSRFTTNQINANPVNHVVDQTGHTHYKDFKLPSLSVFNIQSSLQTPPKSWSRSKKSMQDTKFYTKAQSLKQFF